VTNDYSSVYAIVPASLSADIASSDVTIFFGHGDWDSLIVHDGSGSSTIWFESTVGSSASTPPAISAGALSGKIIVAIACQAGHGLGKDAHILGATAFVGFMDSVAYVATPRTASTHFEDAFVAGPNQVLTGLVAGKSKA
jgi:hypothetical protein